MRNFPVAIIFLLMGYFVPHCAKCQSTSSAPKQLVVDYSHKPTLWSLDATSGDVTQSQSTGEYLKDKLIPWSKWSHHHFIWKHSSVVFHSPDCHLAAFDVRSDYFLFGVDTEQHRLCGFDSDGRPEAALNSEPLISPVAIAVTPDFAYISDKGAGRVLVFSFAQNAFVDSFWDDQPVPDKLIADDDEIVGMNYRDGTITQMYIVPKSSSSLDNSSPKPGSLFRIHRIRYDNIREPIDFDVDGQAVYVLQKSNQLVYVPLFGNHTTLLNLKGILQTDNPTAFALDRIHLLRLVFSSSSSRGEVLQGIQPASVYIEKDVGPNVVATYEYLAKRRLLPTGIRSFDTITGFTEALQQEGLEWSGPQHKQIVTLLEKLNRIGSEDGLIRRVPSGLVLPSITFQRYEGKQQVVLKAVGSSGKPQDLKSVMTLLNASSATETTLRSSPPDTLTKSLLHLNPGYNGHDILAESSGAFIIPVPNVSFAAFTSERINTTGYNKRSGLGTTTRFVPLGRTGIATQSMGANGTQEQPRAGTVPLDISSHPWDKFIVPCQIAEGRAVEIGIVDFKFFYQHPEFTQPNRIRKYVAPNTQSPVESDSALPVHSDGNYISMATSGATRKATIEDHGTHVAAIAAGAMSGVNPSAQVVALSVDNNDLEQAVDPADSSIGIFNLSLGEKYYSQDMSSKLTDWIQMISDDKNDNILFVIAAGNDHKPIQNSMLAFEGERNNVLVVAASDTVSAAPPREWIDIDQAHGSNFGDKSVSLYAPGYQIVSATFDGHYGVDSGTSMSAAFVSGAASLLKSEEPLFSPWQIKERLITTSTMSGWIDRTHSEGGMLNVCRAVQHLHRTVVKFAYEASDCIADVRAEKGAKISISGDPNWTNPIAFSDIRRIHRVTPGGDEFQLFLSYSDARRADTGGPLAARQLYRTRIVHSADIHAPSLTLLNATGCSAKKHLDLTLVDDLYNPVDP